MATYPNFYDFFTTTSNYRVVARPMAILGGTYLAFAYLHSGGWWKERMPRVCKRSITLAALHGGEMALRRLKDYQEARTDAQNLDGAENTLQNLLFLNNNHDQLDFPSIQILYGIRSDPPNFFPDTDALGLETLTPWGPRPRPLGTQDPNPNVLGPGTRIPWDLGSKPEPKPSPWTLAPRFWLGPQTSTLAIA
ncbi:hypothetical protein G4B88_031186 [Cannabis sativa]|uniref:Uncharacterized protein n=1 Tax=Cannabis sativa TaxID=3483 RepID=A0A7J6GTE6_CANSA|nr:hypothetical protein G4B88_031186 [Cannabis sativa]